jgi:mersacidin/lichenicidin family type 2 lantibiotic
MSQHETIRAWKDPKFRSTLTPAQLKALPANPAGLVELSDTELMETGGGTTIICVTVLTVTLLWPTPAY